MESMVSKTLMKVMSFFGSLLLTLFAGATALMALSCLFCSIIEKDLLSVVAGACFGFIAYVCWSVRRDV